MRRRQVTHRATYAFTGLSHWASCLCGWRSGLRDTKREVEQQFQRHVEEA